MIIPYHVDVPMARVPVSNFAITGLTCLAYVLFLVSGQDLTEKLVVEPWVVWGGHLFLHTGILHLLGNMIFLWVFGNAVCAKVGNVAYPVVYAGLGLVAECVHLLVDGRPGVGSSGAINGIVGMYVVWYALNDISCYCLFGYYNGTIAVSSFWMILLWFALDVWGAASGGDHVAYWSHLGGFAGGIGLASLLLATGVVQMSEGERSLFDVLAGRG